MNSPTEREEGRGLTKRQITFLRFHADEPAPYRWAWQTEGNSPVHGPPETWRRLRAWKHGPNGGPRTTFVSAPEMDGLRGYFDGFPKVNAAGLAAIAKATQADSQ